MELIGSNKLEHPSVHLIMLSLHVVQAVRRMENTGCLRENGRLNLQELQPLPTAICIVLSMAQS